MKGASVLPVWVWGIVFAAITCVAVRDALRWYGRPVPGLLVDPAGRVASIGLPNWEGKRRGIKFPDAVAPVHAFVAGRGSRAHVDSWDRAVLAAPGGTIDAVLSRGTQRERVRLTLKPIEPAAWWTYAGSFIIGGLLYAGAGLIALWSSPRGRLARAFATFALSCSAAMLSFFSAHTERTLVPVTYLSFSMGAVSLVLLMLHLPEPAPFLERVRWFEPATKFLAACFGAFAVVAWFAGGDTSVAADVMTASLGLGFLIFVSGFVVRYARARGDQKRTLKALLLSMVPPYAALAVFLVLVMLGVRFPDFLIYPALIFAPLACLYAFVKHDLWGSRAHLSRIGTNLFLGTVACTLAIGAGAAIATWFGAAFLDAFAGAAGGGVMAAVLVALSLRLSDFTLFRSRAQYKPTIDRLSEELVNLTSPADVALAIERTVKRWLRCDFIDLTLASPERLAANSVLRAEMGENEASTSALPSSEEPLCSPRADLRLEVSFGARPFGWLDVGAKRGGALFTSDDIDLLRTIANQGGLALAHAHAYQELEHRRRQQAQAWRGEREALVETVAAEIAHEIRYPLNYFRSLFERGARTGKLTADDIDVGREEVDRLERLVAGLKRMVAHRTERSPTLVSELCSRVEALLRDSLGKLRIELSLGPDATLRCDSDKLTQVLVNLLSNALEACGPNGRAGISWRATPQGGELRVWDDGPGFVGESSRLFAPWYTTKPRGTGLGLAITHRLVRAHGWSISAFRDDSRTVFAIAIRAEDIVRDAAPDSQRRNSDSEARVA